MTKKWDYFLQFNGYKMCVWAQGRPDDLKFSQKWEISDKENR